MSLRPLVLMLPASLLLAACTVQIPASASQGADGHCPHNAPRSLALDLDGVTAVALELGPDTLVLTGQAGSTGQLEGRVCAAKADQLDSVQLVQRREGTVLTVRAERPTRTGLSLGRTAWLDLRGSLPDSIPVTLRLGSGEFQASRLAALKATIGSGDVEASDIAGDITLTVGSGDVSVRRAGSLALDNLGSGELEASDITGDLRVGNIGSGDVSAERVGGHVQVGNIGSGDLTLTRVTGNVEVDAIGSGDVRAREIGGGLTVRRLGSGDIRHEQVSGPVSVPRGR